MSQQYSWPAGSSITLTAEGGNGGPIPTESILIAGKSPTSTLLPLNTDASGNLIVSPLSSSSVVTANQGTNAALALAWPVKLTDGTNVNSFTANGLKVDVQASALPTGASTSALQTQISGQLPTTLGQQLMAASLSVAIASDQSTLPVSAASLPLPAGAATALNQTNASQKSQIVDGSGNVISSTGNALDINLKTSSITLPVSISGNQAINLVQVAGASISQGHGTAATAIRVELPTDGTGVVGLNTGSNIVGKVGIDQTTPGTTNRVAANLDQVAGSAVSLGQKTSANSIPMVLASDQSTIKTTTGTPTAGTVTQAAITVGTSAVRLTVSGSAPSSTRSVLVATVDSQSVATFYVGSSGVANSGASRGIQILAGQPFIANDDAGDYYIISSTAAQTVYVMEQA